MGYPKRSQYKCAIFRCRVRNWADYQAGLQRRGALTVWLSDDAHAGVGGPDDRSGDAR